MGVMRNDLDTYTRWIETAADPRLRTDGRLEMFDVWFSGLYWAAPFDERQKFDKVMVELNDEHSKYGRWWPLYSIGGDVPQVLQLILANPNIEDLGVTTKVERETVRKLGEKMAGGWLPPEWEFREQIGDPVGDDSTDSDETPDDTSDEWGEDKTTDDPVPEKDVDKSDTGSQSAEYVSWRNKVIAIALGSGAVLGLATFGLVQLSKKGETNVDLR